MKHFSPFLILAIAAGHIVARAEVKLPAVISDHMVLQADAPAAIWGWAEPGEEVTVSIAGKSQGAKAGPDGTWDVKLGKLPVQLFAGIRYWATSPEDVGPTGWGARWGMTVLLPKGAL